MPSIRLRRRGRLQNKPLSPKSQRSETAPELAVDGDMGIDEAGGNAKFSSFQSRSSLFRSVHHVPRRGSGMMDLRVFPRRAAHYAIRGYQLSLSAFVGQYCRHLPTCSAYMDEAIARHGLWAGGFMGLARLCRCQPWGTHGFDPVPQHLPDGSSWTTPWRYGRWRGPLICEEIKPESPSAGGEKREVQAPSTTDSLERAGDRPHTII